MYTVPLRALRKIIDGAAKYGVSAQQLCEGLPLAPSLFDKPDILNADCRVPFGQMVSLYERAARLTGDDAFGLHVGKRTRHEMYDFYGYVLMNCPTLGVVLNRAVRYQSIWTDGAVFRLIVERSKARLIYEYVDVSTPLRRQDCEMTLSAVTTLIRRITDAEKWNPLEVHFRHERPKSVSEHRRLFRAPVFFSKPENELIIASSALDLPVTKADPHLFSVLDRYAQDLVSKLPPQNEFVDRVREVVHSTISSGEVGLRLVAKRMGISSRTIQRRLQQEGTSLHELLQQIRRELSFLYLRSPDVALSEVSYLLGFAEPSAFHHAFRKWTGKTPTQYRRGL